MNVDFIWHWIRRHSVSLVIVVLLVLLAAKFFYTLWRFDLPLGYDPGMYRYLFIKYADALKSLSLPELRPWAQEYPYGLYLISSPLIALGLPVDWLLGWMWSVMAIALLAVYAFIFAKREGKAVGVVMLLLGFTSIAYYDGFAQMYWKTYAALLFLILAFHFFEKKSPWMVLFGALTIMTHNQTGLILALALIVWWLVLLPREWNDPLFRKWTLAFAGIALLGLVWYIPHWERVFWSPFKSIFLLRGDDAPGGHFPAMTFYIKYGGILLALGITGWLMRFRQERFSVWIIAPLVCAVFIIFKLVFYRRFFLQLDFFLLPFAAIALVNIWGNIRSNIIVRSVLVILVAAQAALSVPQMLRWELEFSTEELIAIESIPEYVEEDASIIALENFAAVWLLGWLPGYHTGGPGLFDFPAWEYGDWEDFFFKTHEDRLRLLSSVKERPLYLMTSTLFYRHYGKSIRPFLEDGCFEKVEGAPLYRVVCGVTTKETKESKETKETEGGG
ncbi:hypothetical protein KKC44_04125 [Patescibacteria group bacterium]|nr:hypothetical protein [Patescibacteria group bacterium]MBU2259769.1 hypothetical protein [Patescibacteria group bacterium]